MRKQGASQQQAPGQGNKADIVRQYFTAFVAKDRAFFEKHLAEDFTFTSPYDDAIGKAAYFERCWPNNASIEKHVIERIFVQGDEAFVTYRCVAHGDKEFRNTEFFVFAGDSLRQVHVYFGESYKGGHFVRQQ
jgi:ketosteroid isomerase-like protein